MRDTTAGAAESLTRPGGKIVGVDQTLREPHSTRKYLPKPVVHALVDEALAVARCARSNISGVAAGFLSAGPLAIA
jgi:hypothetical protein